MLTANTYAFEILDEFEIKNNTPIDSVKPASKDVVELKIKNIEKSFNEKTLKLFKKEDEEKALKNAEKVDKVIKQVNTVLDKEIEEDLISILNTSEYDQNKAKLRQANFIEGILDLDEGMSELQIYKVGVTHANTARSWALNTYPNSNQVMIRDAARHFSWNHISTKDSTVGKTKTRTATINHEWGTILLNPILSYHENKYKEYVKQGVSDPANKAFANTLLYIPTLKYELVSASRNSYSFFKALFDVSHIMDLHNNCFGRAYPERNSSQTYASAFNTALSKNELILNETNVVDSHYRNVWQSEWYTY